MLGAFSVAGVLSEIKGPGVTGNVGDSVASLIAYAATSHDEAQAFRAAYEAIDSVLNVSQGD